MVKENQKSKAKSQRSKAWRFLGALLLNFALCLLPFDFALGQQPQTSAAPVFATNAKYVQGVAPGYWPTAGSGLTLDLSAGTSFCGNPPVAVFYAGGTLTMTASQTNYVYLDPAATCAPAFNTTGFPMGRIPLAKVVTSGSAITSITDVRTWSVDSNVQGPFVRADLMPGANVTAQLDAANASCGSSPCLIVIPSSMGAGDLTPVIAPNVTMLDLRAGQGTSANKSIAFNALAGMEPIGQLSNFWLYSPANSMAGYWGVAGATGTIGAGSSIEGGNFQGATWGAITTPGNNAVLIGGEMVAEVGSTGGTLGKVVSTYCSVVDDLGATTAVTQAACFYGSSIGHAGGATYNTAFTAILENEILGTARNGSLWAQGPISINAGSQGIRWWNGSADIPFVEDTAGVLKFHAAVDGNGFSFGNAAGTTQWAKLTASTLELDDTSMSNSFINIGATAGGGLTFNTAQGSNGADLSATFRGSVVSGLTTVSFSSTPAFNANAANTFKITLTGNVTSSTLSNAAGGEQIHFIICQDGNGNRTFVWPSNVKGGMTIGSTASKCNAQNFIFDGTNAYALSPGVSNL